MLEPVCHFSNFPVKATVRKDSGLGLRKGLSWGGMALGLGLRVKERNVLDSGKGYIASDHYEIDSWKTG